MPRIPESVKNPAKIIGSSRQLSRIYRHARDLLAVQEKLRHLVPAEVYVAGFDDGTLHLVTPSAALATRLRYQQRELAGSLHFSGQRITNIRVSVRPELASPPTAPAGHRELSPANARHVAETANYIEDERLREALIKLSRHGAVDPEA